MMDPAYGSSPRGRGTQCPHARSRPGIRFIPARAGNTRPTAYRRARPSVHPRAGGEHTVIVSGPVTVTGSSPRGRGTRIQEEGEGRIPRFIPARAGNTFSTSARKSSKSVHPRAGGEHSSRDDGEQIRFGSSPRGRGTPIDRYEDHPQFRFIPARAGNTILDPLPPPPPPVHPRAGGEHRDSSSIRIPIFGSSPRGRGTQPGSRNERGSIRFIPARAGNTDSRGSPHPHPPGSSPRGRGTPRLAFADGVTLRFIPARAGNTRHPLESMLRRPVHPRAGGEHLDLRSIREKGIGSSPRGRGTLIGERSRKLMIRFIPARAGNTSDPISSKSRYPVHPRAGGEHLYRERMDLSLSGSSPRGRGTLIISPMDLDGNRFIPARAGNTQISIGSEIHESVHPRAGGEHPSQKFRWCLGSHRFIPARAGNTRRRGGRG